MENNSTAKVITVLDYIGILWILGLFVEKDHPAVKFHTNQGLTLFILGIVASVVGALSFVPLVGFVFGLIGSLLGLCCLVLAILGIVHAVQGECKPLPIIGGLLNIIK